MSRWPDMLESRDPHSIHFSPTEWGQVRRAAVACGRAPSVFVREVVMDTVKVAHLGAGREASTQVLGDSALVDLHRIIAVLGASTVRRVLVGALVAQQAAAEGQACRT